MKYIKVQEKNIIPTGEHSNMTWILELFGKIFKIAVINILL